MKTLYEAIKSSTKENIEETFKSLLMNEGYEILKRISNNDSDITLIAKYVSTCYDPNSPPIKIHPTRASLTKHAIEELGIDERLIDGNDDNFRKYVDWYYSQIQDYNFVLINTLKELIEQQVGVARMTVSRGSGENQLDEDKFFKAINTQNTCMQNAINNVSELESLKAKRDRDFERTDEAIANEITRNSDMAEQGAIYAKELKNKGK
jgi:hypothetical protein